MGDYEDCGGTCATAKTLGACADAPGFSLTFQVRISSGSQLSASLSFEEGQTYYVISKWITCSSKSSVWNFRGDFQHERL